MELVLLFFCVTSIIVTSIIVALELKGEKNLSMQSSEGEINTTNFHGQRILEEDLKTNQQLRSRVYETLDQQLNQLGYVSKEPQLQFINSTLKSDHRELDELTPSELQTAFIAILDARESNGAVSQS